ncbi:hypothetical protein [Nocardioides marinisabuli]|uniref:primosomal protein N' family DNA-binding protein n=1 Tax=Nocardioides marinisabuli TaxID=419476 RepID=UPI00308463EB
MPARPEDAQPELLPGLVRATLKESQAKARATRERKAAQAETAAELPVARVLVDVPLAHLDRPFDFSVPASMADDAVPGARVKVRFAGKETDGFLVERAATSEHTGALLPLRRVVSAEPVLTPEVAALTAAVAERYAGSRADVLRLAVPPRHATTEKAEVATPPPAPAHPLDDARAAWAEHAHAAAWLGHLRDGGAPRAVWNPPPGADWPLIVAHAALSAPGGVVVCLPDGKDVERVDAALTSLAGERPEHAVLTADLGPAARYRSFLQLARGHRRIAVGTRAAAFAPVADLSLVVVWDDGDDLHAEPRAPYCHTRETLLLRAELAGAAALVGGFARSVEADHLLRSGWAHELVAPRERVRAAARVEVAGATDFDLVRDPGPAPAGCHARSSTCCARPCPRARCWCRTRARATSRPWPASAAAPRRAARRAPARCACPRRPPRPRAAGAAPRRPPGPAPSAATAACGRRSWARRAPPRSSVARSRRCGCAPPRATACWPGSTRSPR